ncbi:CoA pyrophosphatase [Riemerella anatipestifer]|uniref:NUDIX hydrolase n=1 Tax=Riemerella anatipestifer TaxID=34085 RepID=UPI00208F1D58|nr:CoA pyrophosphatase [Riemerella anatipestifer]MCO4304139.1 CoA pyrophosphatase [Riemerella anatipestifer]MCT6761163.1 CoA pyrophosphatase [Riemerella anatipestifer]MCU7599922.1 CoA pyrophosphatase [Riemerella anatipestifer]MCU7605953.1 CoA pyrophosphatase [Riemerella anatipestifer]MDR7714780.1 CoA pyrophosphatase [Riemerella anatipestifer]
MKLGRDLIKRIKAAPLEGENAHKIYAPPQRPLYSYDEIMAKKPKLAAVNILLYLKNNQWHIPLMVRTANVNDKHSGQISLPGGKKEVSDETFAHTALRETTEELGIIRPYLRLIRSLSPLYIPPSNFYVHTYVSYTKKNPKFTLQESEAQELIELPLSLLLDLPKQPSKILFDKHIEIPVIQYKNYNIWGATSMILYEFSQLLKNM